MRTAYLCFGLALLLAMPAMAADIVQGRASVIDGDTLDIRGERIRLFGVDAPESAQSCADGKGVQYRCGQRAAIALANRIGAAPVTCTRVDKDQYGRTVAKCRAGQDDINAWLVENGWAVAYRAYAKDYVAAEATAKSAHRNIWGGAFTLPWEWRAQQRPPVRSVAMAARPPQSGCAIKGNRNAKGECVYHVPGSRDYDRTVVTESKGEHWFCSVAAAVAAGCRAAR